MIAIQCSNISKRFRTGWRTKVKALEGVDLEVKKGEIFGILGPNGAGKTTLVKTILNLVWPDTGTVEIFGVDNRNHQARNSVGYLPENPSLPDYLKGRQVMELYGSLSGMTSHDVGERVEKMLAEVKMSQWKEKKPTTYSKGMVQRLGLAQALISDPDLIFLDEPTDGVDPIGRREIRDVLIELKNRGKTVFLNSHLLSETEMVCDRVAVMNKGVLVSIGGVEELTVSANRYSIKCTNIDEAAMSEISSSIPRIKQNNGFIEAIAEDVTVLNSIIDKIRGQGILIESVLPVRQSLESYFVDLIKDVREEEN